MENLVGQQAGEHQIEYRIGTGGGLFDPELGVAGLRLVGDLRQDRIEQLVAGRRRIDQLRNERHKTSLAGGPSVSRPAGHHHRDRPGTLLYHPPGYANVCPAPIDNLEAPPRRTDLLRTAAPQAPRLRPMCARAA